MTSAAPFSPNDYIKGIAPETHAAFRALRDAVFKEGPLEANVLELILIGSFATTGNEPATKAHATRLLEAGVAKEAIRQAALVTLAATAPFINVTRALKWIDETADAFEGKS